MNQMLIAHVTAEVVIVGGLSYYFMKKLKQNEDQMKLLETRVQDLDAKVKSADKHIQTLYQMIEGLAEQAAPPPPRRGGYMGQGPSSSGMKADSLRNRKQKMRVVPMRVDDEEDDIIELEPSHGSSVEQKAGSGPMGIGMGGFPLGAIFEMMGPGPMGGFFQASPPKDTLFASRPTMNDAPRDHPSFHDAPVVVEDEDDDNDQDIQDELKELGVQPESEASK